MYNNTSNWFFVINNKKNGSFVYGNDDFSFKLIASSMFKKNFANNTYKQTNFHFHNYYEIHIILDGASIYELENKNSFDVKKGNFVIFPPKIKHKITSETPFFSKLIIAFDFYCKNNTNQFYNLLNEKLKNCNVLPYRKHLHTVFQTIFQLSQTKNFNYELSCFFLETYIIMEIFNSIMEKENISSYIKYDDARINNAVDYIKSNLSATLKVSDVAKHLNLSTRQFSKIFTEQTGVSPGKYISNQTMIYSIDMLINSDLSINDIVSMLAFPDASTFIKAFKKAKGITPSKYRKMHKKF